MQVGFFPTQIGTTMIIERKSYKISFKYVNLNLQCFVVQCLPQHSCISILGLLLLPTGFQI